MTMAALLAACAGTPQPASTLQPFPGSIGSAYPSKQDFLNNRSQGPGPSPHPESDQASAETSTSASETPLKLCSPSVNAGDSNGAKKDDHELLVSVRNSAGAPISNLKATDFVVYSPSQRFPVTFLNESRDVPTSIVIAIDSSGSMGPKLETVRATFAKFLLNLNRCDEVAIFSFTLGSSDPDFGQNGTSSGMVQLFTTDHALANTRLKGLMAQGQTPLYDAILVGLKVLATAHYGNRYLIVVTDGMDNASKASKGETTAEVRKDGWPAYFIGIGDPNAPEGPQITIGPIPLNVIGSKDRVDAKGLEELAKASGGRAFIVPPMSNDGGRGFIDAISAIGNTPEDVYAIGVTIPSASGWPAGQMPSVSVPSHPEAIVHVQMIDRPPAETPQ